MGRRLVALTIASLAVAAEGQSQARLSFDVASVRPSAPPASGLGIPIPRGMRTLPSGQFNGDAPLRNFISWAYALQPYQRIEGSFPELDQWFTIVAKAPGSVKPSAMGVIGEFNLMLQSLLADRFKLKLRSEPRQETVYILRRIDSGSLRPTIKVLDVDCSPASRAPADPLPRGCGTQIAITNGKMAAYVATMANFAWAMSQMAERPIVDETGLAGPLELAMTFDPASLSPRPRSSPLTAQLPAFTDALRDDLGLKLESERRDVPALIVEHVESPTPN